MAREAPRHNMVQLPRVNSASPPAARKWVGSVSPENRPSAHSAQLFEDRDWSAAVRQASAVDSAAAFLENVALTVPRL